jgi:hypothetical protein
MKITARLIIISPISSFLIFITHHLHLNFEIANFNKEIRNSPFVDPTRFELVTSSLQMRRSAIELRALIFFSGRAWIRTTDLYIISVTL